MSRRLGVGDCVLVAEATLLVCLVRVGLRILPFGALRRFLNQYAGRGGADHDGASSEGVRHVAHAVMLVARRLPGTTTCLVDALSANAMLRRRGYAADLCFGLRRPGSGSERWEAHAWIEHHGTVILGKLENLTDYALLTASGFSRPSPPRPR